MRHRDVQAAEQALINLEGHDSSSIEAAVSHLEAVQSRIKADLTNNPHILVQEKLVRKKIAAAHSIAKEAKRVAREAEAKAVAKAEAEAKIEAEAKAKIDKSVSEALVRRKDKERAAKAQDLDKTRAILLNGTSEDRTGFQLTPPKSVTICVKGNVSSADKKVTNTKYATMLAYIPCTDPRVTHMVRF